MLPWPAATNVCYIDSSHFQKFIHPAQTKPYWNIGIFDAELNNYKIFLFLIVRSIFKNQTHTHPVTTEHYMQVKWSAAKESSHVQWDDIITQAHFFH